ncbi:hypothetical protein [Porphyrobacter sp. HT-58-2]|uniref:hypothetical protein n=1 Tax=Porphyrobacter sp. HT-58-2 TaxID=2023229 RepID=UPI0011B001F3|nr:hypothetical protein [Porphyrobacter sp. HT-58-2]
MRSQPVASRGLFAGTFAGIALALAAPASAQDQGAPDITAGAESTAPTEGEQRLAKLLEGREAGTPQDCIRTIPNQRVQTIDGTAYVYGSGSTIYVQRTRNPADIKRTNALLTNRFNGTQLCRMDVITTFDPVLGFFTGVVFFEDFVPYTKVKGEG